MIMEISVDLKDAYDWKEDYIRFNKNSTIKYLDSNNLKGYEKNILWCIVV